MASANLDRVRRQRDAPVLPVQFVQGNWLDPLPSRLRGAIDVIVSNPPYVADAEWPGLPGEVRREPLAALVARRDRRHARTRRRGGSALRAWVCLRVPGAVVIELAPHQADAAALMARRMGYVDVRVETDLARRPWALVGRTR